MTLTQNAMTEYSDKVGLNDDELAHWTRNILRAALAHYDRALSVFREDARLSQLDLAKPDEDEKPLVGLLEGKPKWWAQMTVEDIRKMLREMVDGKAPTRPHSKTLVERFTEWSTGAEKCGDDKLELSKSADIETRLLLLQECGKHYREAAAYRRCATECIHAHREDPCSILYQG